MISSYVRRVPSPRTSGALSRSSSPLLPCLLLSKELDTPPPITELGKEAPAVDDAAAVAVAGVGRFLVMEVMMGMDNVGEVEVVEGWWRDWYARSEKPAYLRAMCRELSTATINTKKKTRIKTGRKVGILVLLEACRVLIAEWLAARREAWEGRDDAGFGESEDGAGDDNDDKEEEEDDEEEEEESAAAFEDKDVDIVDGLVEWKRVEAPEEKAAGAKPVEMEEVGDRGSSEAEEDNTDVDVAVAVAVVVVVVVVIAA